MRTAADISRPSGLKLAEELQRKLVNALDNHIRVILFGSHARGDATEESDIDVLVVLPNLEKNTLGTVRHPSSTPHLQPSNLQPIA